MSRIEKIVVIILISVVLSGIAISYYNKISQKKIQITPAKLARQAEIAKDIIAERNIVDINIADKYTLAKLPGVGPHLAQRIIDYRRESGRFSSPCDLMKVKGIGPKKYQSMKEYIRVDE